MQANASIYNAVACNANVALATLWRENGSTLRARGVRTESARNGRRCVTFIDCTYICTPERPTASSPRDAGEKKGNLVIKQLHLSHPSEHAVLSMRAFYLSRIKKNVHVAETCGARIFLFFLWSLLTRKEVGEDVSVFERSGKTSI